MKYILIKRYPGSPKLGTVYTRLNNHFLEDEGIPSKTFMDHEFSNHWKEFIKKDYEILSLIHKKQKTKILLAKDANIDLFLECKTDYNYWDIHSIKRLSDGEIFTVGDKLDEKSFTTNARHNLTVNPIDLYDNKIIKMAIVKNYHAEVAGYSSKDNLTGTLMFSASNKWNNLNVSLKDAIKCKQPLFTTEDSVDIFEGDEFYFLQKDWLKIFNNYGKLIAEKNAIAEFAHKRFSTKEKAEEYILMNKPVLSLNDIQNNSNITIGGMKSLTNLVRTKLNM